MKTIIIACANCPSKSTWPEFEQTVRSFFPSIGKMGITDGPGCANLVIEVPENEMDEIAQQLCLTMFPARWSVTADTAIEGFQIQAPELQH